MAISQRAAGAWAASSGMTIPPGVVIPAGWVAGDLGLLVAVWKPWDVSATIAQGWTEIIDESPGTTPPDGELGSVRLFSAWKVLTASETAPTVSLSAPSSPFLAVIVVLRRSTSDPWSVTRLAAAVEQQLATTAMSHVLTTLAAIAANDWIFALTGTAGHTDTFSRATDAISGGPAWAANVVEFPASHGTTVLVNRGAADLIYRVASGAASSGAGITVTATLDWAMRVGSSLIRVRLVPPLSGSTAVTHVSAVSTSGHKQSRGSTAVTHVSAVSTSGHKQSRGSTAVTHVSAVSTSGHKQRRGSTVLGHASAVSTSGERRTLWMVEIDRLAGAGWEDWSASVDPWPETEIESVAVNRAGRAQVTFTDPPAIPVHGWLLRVRRGTVSQFVGRIIGLAHRDGGSTIGPRVIVVTATDWDSLLDDDVVPHRYRTVAETAGARIRWLVDTFGTRGITAALPHNQDILAMPGGLDGRPEQEFGPSTLREAIRKVTRISGGSIYVDGDKRLRHFLAENIAAPFGLSDTPNESTTFGYDEFRLDDDDSPRVDEVVVFGAAGIEVTRVVANPPPLAHRRRAPLVDDSLASIAQAEAAGDAFLRANAARRSGSLRTLRSGLGAGMDVQITHQGHGWVARAMRIHGVTTRFDGPDDSPVHQVHFGDPPIDLAEIIGGGTSGVRVVATEASRAVDAVLHQLSVLQAAGANLVVNSSFESVSSQGDWTVGAQWVHGFVPVDPERAFAGTRTARAAPSNTTVGDLTHARVPIDRSADYWLSLWTFMRAWTAGSMAVFVDEFDAAGASLAQTQIATLGTADTAWRRHAIRMGPNDQLGRRAFAAATASIRLRLVGPAAGTFVCDTDGWQIERGTVLTAYAPAPQELRDGQVGTTQIADSSITTPKLTAGSVVAHTIAVGAVLADKIAAGAITADKMAAQIILAGLLATATTGRRVEIDRSGIRCIDENGKTLVNIPTALNAPVSVVGQVETSALTALGSTELRGATTLAVAGTTTATVGLADPTLAPTVSMPTLVTTTPEAVPPRDFGSQGFASGINHDPSGHGGVPTWWLGAQGGDNFNQGPVPIAYEHRVSDGARLRGILMGVIEGAQVVGRYAVGVARAGTRIWVLLSSGRLVAHNQATLAQEVNILHSAIDAGLFFDGTHLVIVTVTGTTGTDQLRFRRVNTADGNLHSTLDATGFPVNGDTVILRGGAMRPDPLNGNVNTYWVTVNGVVRAFRMDTGAHVPNREFGEPGRTGSGLTWNGSVFQGWSPDSPHLITTYGDWDWTTESPVYWVGYTWYKSTATTRETSISPRGQLTMGRRRTMRVDNPLIPTGSGEFPDRVRLYMNRGASDPGPGNYRRQVEDALTTRVCPPFNAAGAADPLTNTFPPAVPHEIRSAVQPGWILRGDGTAVLPGGGRFVARTSLLSITVTAETQVIALTMPAGSMQAGTSFRIRALARLSSATSSTTHTFRCRIGPTTLTGSIAASLDAVRPDVTVADAPFTVDVLVTVRTTGTTGTCIGQIVVLSRSTTPVAFTPSNVISAHSATVAVNTTVQNIVEMTSTGSSTLDTTNFENVTLEAIHPA